MYTDDQVSEIKEDLREFLYYFGYASHPDESQQDTSTIYFDYS